MKLKCFWVQPLHAVSGKFLSCEDNYQQASTDVSNSSIRNATAGKPDVSCDLLFTQPDSIRGPSLTGSTKHDTSGTSPHDTQVESRQASAQGCASAAGFVELATESKQDNSSAHVSQLPKYISKNSQTTVFLHHKSAIPFSINGNGPLFPHADLETRPSQATDYWKFPGTLEASAAAPNRRDFSAACSAETTALSRWSARWQYMFSRRLRLAFRQEALASPRKLQWRAQRPRGKPWRKMSSVTLQPVTRPSTLRCQIYAWRLR